MIPTKRNRLIQLPVDAAIYALRNIVERCFNELKNARSLATRYNKTVDSYLGLSQSSQSACGHANLSTPPRSKKVRAGALDSESGLSAPT